MSLPRSPRPRAVRASPPRPPFAPVTTLLPAGLLAGLLAACNAAPPVAAAAAPYVTRPDFRLPEGAGCAGDVARFRAVMANDLETGHVARAVHERVTGEIDGAAALCAAGQDAGARARVAAIKARYGYP